MKTINNSKELAKRLKQAIVLMEKWALENDDDSLDQTNPESDRYWNYKARLLMLEDQEGA